MVDAAPVKVRFRFTKLGKIRFTSHRDVARMWERALRRSLLPVALSQGFSPHPLLSFGLALPTGCESLGEYLDVRLEESSFDPSVIPELPELMCGSAARRNRCPGGGAGEYGRGIATARGSIV